MARPFATYRVRRWNNPVSVCGGWSLVNYRKVPQRAITLFCRSWQCPDCMPRRLSQLKRDAMRGNPSTFITLTVNPLNDESVTERAQHLTDAWRIVVKRARRRWPGKSIDYLAVVEATKLGEPHLHILVRGPYMPQKWLSECMDEIAESPIVDIRKIRSVREVVSYVAKYITKAPAQFDGSKRYWCTQTWEGPRVRREAQPEGPLFPWEVAQHDIATLIREWCYSGWAVRADGKGGIVARPGFQIREEYMMSP